MISRRALKSVASAVLIGVCSGSPLLPAQAPATAVHPRTAALSPLGRDDVLRAVEAAIRTDYVFPEKSAGIIAFLEAALRAGRYDGGDPRQLADAVTHDLLAGSGDHHLYLGYDPARYAAALRPAGSDDTESSERMSARRDNSGLTDMEILPGNLRYLKITQFEWVPDETGAAYDDALRFLRGGDAIIIDLRGNPGGDGAAVRYLVSHFLDPDTLEYTFLEGTQPPVQMRALDYVPAGRIRNKPLYVLIDGGAASAAESFAYDVQQFKLGELVGERTVGGANNNRFVPIAPGFMLSVSYGRPVHAVSGTNWEGVGVAPSVPIAAVSALDEAQYLALERLKSQPGASPAQLSEVDWALVGAASRLHPATLSAAELRALAGRYGDIDVTFGNGRLSFTRADHPASGLSLLTPEGLFAVDGREGLRVRLTGDTLQLLREGDPSPRIYLRGKTH